MTLSARLIDADHLAIVRDGLETRYAIRAIPADPAIAWQAWRLTREDGLGEYDVAMLDGWPSCTCGSMVWTKENKGET